MPDITLPNSLADGTTPTAQQFAENVHKPRTAPDNISVINGQLDWDNFDGDDIKREDVRRGTFTRSGVVGATTNQDWFEDFFGDVESANVLTYSNRFKGSPGLGIAWYVPWAEGASSVKLWWHVSLVVDAGNTQTEYDAASGLIGAGGNTWLRLYVDDTATIIQRPFLNGRHSMIPTDGPSGDVTPYNDSTRPDVRMWSSRVTMDDNGYNPLGVGQLEPWARGWHTASIRLCTPAPHVRLRVRRMGYRLYR